MSEILSSSLLAVVSSNLIVTILVALLIAVIAAYVLRAMSVPDPIPWLVALVVLLVIVFADSSVR